MSKSGKCKIIERRTPEYISSHHLEVLRLARIANITEKIERIETWQNQGKAINQKSLDNLKEKLSILSKC